MQLQPACSLHTTVKCRLHHCMHPYYEPVSSDFTRRPMKRKYVENYSVNFNAVIVLSIGFGIICVLWRFYVIAALE